MKIEIIDLVKDYGKFRALDGVSLTINRGMFGLLGPNGAGKTTLMRVITTLMPVTTGQVRVGGIDVMRDPGFVRKNLGYIPQDFGFYKSLNAYELLDYIGVMKGLTRIERQKQVKTLLEQVNLTKDAKRRVGGYSGGMKQRLGIAQALLGDPQLIIVDEPTAGLDPEERIRFRNLLTRLSGERTVLLSTHIVGDIEASCSAVAVLNRGQVIFSGAPETLMRHANGRIWQVEIEPREYEQIESTYRVTASRTASGRMLVRVLSLENPLGRGIPVEPELEEGYMAVITATEKEADHA
ncbi:MAG: ABC transporter ATP-binding protein [Chloroflexi bacterium]|uniref:ABC transporter ATP-binding protein n=1 Tax=Candidatus Flexifilum breve TaxID=3140694 RepID=UPI003135D44D|nr:ABC transporter ATP-binding protein [Chloroflexota bacterium]MBK9748070.1 ABC transporter ATP-binding protein [Chloroflexota bacterium]